MICSNCGKQNETETKFCIGCGHPMIGGGVDSNTSSNNDSNISSTPTAMEENDHQQVVVNQNTNNNANVNTVKKNIKINIKDYFFVGLAILLKPYTSFKEEIAKFDDFKFSAIFTLIVSLAATIISLIKTMYNAVRVTSYSFLDGTTTEWVWSNLKEVEYIKVICQNLFMFLGIIFAITAVYYVGALIVKKQSSFSRLLGITAISVIPMVVCSLVLSPLLSLIYTSLGTAVTIVGGIYTLILIYETVNNEILLEGNTKYYFNLICLSILLIAGYFLYMKFLTSSITSDYDSLLEMFGY